MSEARKLQWLSGVALVAIAGMFLFVPPIAQPLAYHDFADPRGWWGIANFGDVMSNIAFIPAGLYGLWVLGQRAEDGPWSRDARLPLAVFFVGVVLVGPGSAYYHLEPNNATLFWDRLPMTVAFMGLTAAVIADRIDVHKGVRIMLPVLILVGAGSAIYWHLTDDLRAYGLVQFLPVLIIPMIMWLWPGGKWITWRAIIWAFVFYGLAKVTEHYDEQIMSLLGGAVSGHTLKHLFAALGPVAVAWTMKPQSGSLA